MKNANYQYNLHELLCLKKFSETFQVFSTEEFCQAAVDWAEREVIAGRASERLLIIASLGLDTTVDYVELERYLLIYLKEQGIQDPSLAYSALVWLRLQLAQLIAASSAQEVERRLVFFTHCYLDDIPPALFRITHLLSGLYWELYDEAVPVFYSRAYEMSEYQLLNHVTARLQPLYRILCNPDWMHVLTSALDPGR